jgi:endonuclease YncB( thermonuclease family)
MKAQLFLIYLRYRYFFVSLLAAIAILPIAFNCWSKKQLSFAANHPWQVTDVLGGDRFTVSSNNQTQTIKLCGVSAGEEAKDYLRSLVNKGNGTVEIEKVGDSFEAWVMLKPDFESQIHLNVEMLASGMASLDSVTADKCLGKENLIYAEEAAKKDKLGVWNK